MFFWDVTEVRSHFLVRIYAVDAWTFGAGDPVSGHSVLLEIARVFSELNKQGWKPRRTIVIASWDAEEYALIGSVEFVESYYSTLQARAVAYINLDVAVHIINK